MSMDEPLTITKAYNDDGIYVIIIRLCYCKRLVTPGGEKILHIVSVYICSLPPDKLYFVRFHPVRHPISLIL